jgi:hypothetical protein
MITGFCKSQRHVSEKNGGTYTKKQLKAKLNDVKSGKPLTEVGQAFSSIFWNTTTTENCI